MNHAPPLGFPYWKPNGTTGFQYQRLDFGKLQHSFLKRNVDVLVSLGRMFLALQRTFSPVVIPLGMDLEAC
jgi:hypothetical protein